MLTDCFLACLAGSFSGPATGETLNTFIFSLKNYKALPPFKCLANDKQGLTYTNRLHGPSFGKGPYISIRKGEKKSRAWIDAPFIVPVEMNDEDRKKVLAGTAGKFQPENYEVFSLA